MADEIKILTDEEIDKMLIDPIYDFIEKIKNYEDFEKGKIWFIRRIAALECEKIKARIYMKKLQDFGFNEQNLHSEVSAKVSDLIRKRLNK